MSNKKLTIPTIITLVRIVLIPLFLFCATRLTVAGDILALLVFLIASLSDMLDGHLARKLQQVTDIGKYLDPLADKMLVSTAMVCLCVRGLLPIWIFVLILCRDLAVDGVRLVAAQNGEVIAASIWGKSKTFTQMCLVLLLFLSCFITAPFFAVVCKVFMAAVVILTVFSGYDYLHRGWRYFK